MFPRRLFGWSGLCLLLIGSVSRADVFIFKDGFSVQAALKQEAATYTDPVSGVVVGMPKGTFLLNTPCRRIYFSRLQLLDTLNHDTSPPADLVKYETSIPRLIPDQMVPLIDIREITPWDERWERIFKVGSTGLGANGILKVKQRLTLLTPQVVRVEAHQFTWLSYFSTKELGPDTVVKLISSHADMKNKADAVKRFRLPLFLFQAGWHDEAERELAAFLKDFPDEKAKVETLRGQIKSVRLMDLFEEIERAYQAGRHRFAQSELSSFPVDSVDEKIQARIRSLKSKYETAQENLELTRRFLKETPGRLAFTPQRKLFQEAAQAILGELDLDDFLPDLVDDKTRKQDRSERLDAFVKLAAQAERDRAQNKPSNHTPEELLALAVSGWLLGKNAADTKINSAQKLWQARQFVLKYQKTTAPDERELMLAAYATKKGEAVGVDEMSQLIAFLPPPEPEEKIDSGRQLQMQTDLPWARKKPVSYLLQLPLEYRHSRSHPVLFVLHQAGQNSGPIFQHFRDLAGRHGYILVAPDWEQGLSQTYEYSKEEHDTVLNVLRDLLRRFQVDTDRVFLLGFGEGGNMAFDVGLGHPDLFAGVLTISGRPRFQAVRNWHNGQYLPFYVVDGDHSDDISKLNRGIFREWVPRGYPAIHVQYKGRGYEAYEGEVPSMFDWMEHKRGQFKRARGFPDLGKLGGQFGEEFRSMRQCDNRFYWLSTDAIQERNLNDAHRWYNQKVPAKFQGRISEGNQISVNVDGLKQLTIWLARDVVDFDKSVLIRINGSAPLSRKVQPSMTTLLEDFYRRGDRQRLFVAKLDFDRPS